MSCLESIRYSVAMEKVQIDAECLKGRFIVFDGPDGSGKTTQMNRFLAWCKSKGLIFKEVREPGGTYIGEQIREVLLDPKNKGMTLPCEMLMYMASRAQLMEQEVLPALEAGQVVVADRFISSTLVYQGYAGGLSDDWIKQVGEVALQGCWPDLTLVFDVDLETSSKRLNPLLDRMELKGQPFHQKVREGFISLAENEPEKYVLIDATASADTVEASVKKAISMHFDGLISRK